MNDRRNSPDFHTYRLLVKRGEPIPVDLQARLVAQGFIIKD